MIGCTPMRPNNSIMVVMSCRCGRLQTVTGVSASKVAARIGSAEFFAPEMRISPSRRVPPVMISLSMDVPVTRRLETLPESGRRAAMDTAALPGMRCSAASEPVVAAEEFHGHGMNAAIGDPWIEMGINLLLTLDRTQAGQLVTDHVQLEVAAFAFDFHLCIRKFLFQETLNFYSLHVQPRSAPDAHSRTSYKKGRSLRSPSIRMAFTQASRLHCPAAVGDGSRQIPPGSARTRNEPPEWPPPATGWHLKYRPHPYPGDGDAIHRISTDGSAP